MNNVREKSVFIGKERAGNKEFVTITDVETGEQITSYWREDRKAASGRPPSRKRIRFTKLYDTNLAYLIDKKKLTLTERGVLLSLLRFLDWQSNYLIHPTTGDNMSGSELAKWLQVDIHDMLDYLTRLNNKGILVIVKRGGSGSANHYILNTNLVFRGNDIKDIRQTKHFESECPLQVPVKVSHAEARRVDDAHR